MKYGLFIKNQWGLDEQLNTVTLPTILLAEAYFAGVKQLSLPQFRKLFVTQKKKYSFFKKGMQPTIFSLKRHNITGNGWYRSGTNISYYETKLE